MECRNGSPFGLEPMGVGTQLVAEALGATTTEVKAAIRGGLKKK
jgi:hypothetical protein